jgi:hypothetical protein
MVENSVQKTTQNQYKRHFTEWINFLASYQGDSDTTLQGNLQGVDEEEKNSNLTWFHGLSLHGRESRKSNYRQLFVWY